ncbi:hypothetical protein ACOTJG_26485 [Achromobacter xylosoxidans]|jgi:hypothetical protein|uniref:hypothetical protein n=1 Tax=Alcaligenes xylosoxydans xylosoxydans TaxID=85698 RepID=UPI001EEF53E7|nr:hypothetical protein [Achromobacter xylosoxidans]
MRTSASLGIYWTFVDKNSGEIYQEEVPGLIFFGYWKEGYSSDVPKNISSFKSIWADFSEIKVREWVGEDLSNLSFEMKINLWPTEGRWKESVEASLRWFVNRGALISWCGGEFSSPSLDVFRPDCHAGSIYAAYCNSVGFICGSSLNSEYKDVDVVDVEKFMRVLEK